MTLLSTADWLLSPSTPSPAGLGAAVGAAGVGTQHAISSVVPKVSRETACAWRFCSELSNLKIPVSDCS